MSDYLDLLASKVDHATPRGLKRAEKHICPMPLNITERAQTLWSTKGDTIFSPFAGIGSEGVVSRRLGRRFIGTELHPVYWREAVKNVQNTSLVASAGSLFDFMTSEKGFVPLTHV